MTFPTQVRTYNFTKINQRISFVSLNDTLASLMYGVKNYLVATLGWTVKYTCDGTTGPTSSSDHTDRLSSKSNCTTRGAGSGNAQSFWVLTDANSVDWMFTYQGSSDDIARVSFSKGGLFTPAGTANQQPTATDEEVISSATTIVGATASADRVWNAIGSTDNKSCRIFVFRSAVLVGSALFFESVTSTCASPAVLSPAVVGLAATTFAPATYFNGSQTIGKARPNVSSVDKDTSVIAGFECAPSGTFIDGSTCELQGSNGSLIFPLSGWSQTSGANGKLCNFIDFYKDGNSKADGDLTTDKNWIHLTFSGSNSAGVLSPWDGATAVTTA